MSAPVRLTAFVLAVVVSFVAGLGLGALAGPLGEQHEPPAHPSHEVAP